MSVVWTQVALAGLWGGLVAVERKAFLQAMLSRPLVAATVMGGLLNDVASGLAVGLVLELFFLGTANLGAALPENDTLAATGTSAAAATLTTATGAGSTPAMWSLAVLLFIGLGRVGRKSDRLLEGYSARLARVAQAMGDTSNAREEVLASNAIERVRKLNAAVGIPSRLRDAGVQEKDLPKIADKAFLDASHLSNPRKVTEADLLAMAREAF